MTAAKPQPHPYIVTNGTGAPGVDWPTLVETELVK